MTTTLVLLATPEFVIGTLLATVAGVWLGLFPPVSLVDATQPLTSQTSLFVLPVLTLLAASAAQMVRMVRACMIDALQSEYVEVARLNGVPERRVLFLHALPNALGPTIQVFAQNIGWLVGGVVVVEAVFQFPGLGAAFSDAVSHRDYATVQAIALLVAAVYIGANMVADILNIALNPRLRKS
jgi:peptide/nickel transport system permease protein